MGGISFGVMSLRLGIIVSLLESIMWRLSEASVHGGGAFLTLILAVMRFGLWPWKGLKSS